MVRHLAGFCLIFFGGCLGLSSAAYSSDLNIRFSVKYRVDTGAAPLEDAPVRIVSNFAQELDCDKSSAYDGSVECTVKACGSSSDTHRRMHEIVFGLKSSREPRPRSVRFIVRHRDGKCVLEPSDVQVAVIAIEYLDKVQVASAIQEDIVRLFGNSPSLASLRTDGVRQKVFADGATVAASWLSEPGGVDRFSAVRTTIQERAAEAARRDPSSEQAILYKAQLETLGVAALIGAISPSGSPLTGRMLVAARERGFSGAAAILPGARESFISKFPYDPGDSFTEVIQRAQRGQLGWEEFKRLENLNRFQATIPQVPSRIPQLPPG